MSNDEPIIDSHQHFWQLSRGDYDWMTSEFKPLQKDFLPGDLKPILNKLGVQGTVLVQAAATLEETQFLLSIANDIDFVWGVVGWADMEAKQSPDVIAELAGNPYFCGLRPMIHDLPDIDWMLKDKLTEAFKTLIELGLTFDALVRPAHLKNLMKLMERHPDLKCVIDHSGKPDIANGKFEPWADDIEIIAQNSNAFCKLSGLVTEAGKDWTVDALTPYLDHVLGCFGPDRVMWGSDWPVVTMAASYEQWFQVCRETIFRHYPAALNQIFGTVAKNFYAIS